MPNSSDKCHNKFSLMQLQVTFSEIKSCFKRSFGQLFPKITPDSALIIANTICDSTAKRSLHRKAREGR
jgi:hypothetical protein